MEDVIRRQPATIIDVGCSEGYYAVGLAVRCPAARVIAYDVSERARALCDALARANGVRDRLDIRCECNPEELGRNAQGAGFLLSDCEGYERELFTVESASALDSWDILIELHDFLNADAKRSVQRAFEHRSIILKRTEPRNPTAYDTTGFCGRDVALILNDARGPAMEWAYVAGIGSKLLVNKPTNPDRAAEASEDTRALIEKRQ